MECDRILEYLTQLAFIELAERLLKQKRVLILNFSAAATVANISRLGLHSQHWKSDKPFGLLHDKYECGTVVTIYQVQIDRSYDSPPTFGRKIVQPTTIMSSPHTPSFITTARKIMEDRQEDDDVCSARLQNVFTKHKLKDVQGCDQLHLITCPSLLERLATCVAADDAIKTDVCAIVNKARSPNAAVELLRSATVGTVGSAAASKPLGARLYEMFPSDIGEPWTLEEYNQWKHYLCVFAHVVGVLPDHVKDRIPKRVFQDAGLKTKFWPVPKLELEDGTLTTRYGHGLHRDGFRIRIFASSGGGPEKAKAEYWKVIQAVARTPDHPSCQTVIDILDIVLEWGPQTAP